MALPHTNIMPEDIGKTLKVLFRCSYQEGVIIGYHGSYSSFVAWITDSNKYERVKLKKIEKEDE